MATQTVRKPRLAPVKGANFQPKRIRKQARKGVIRGVVANKVTDVKLAAKERAAFYRRLRELKMRRRQIAEDMATLKTRVQGLLDEVHHVAARYPDGVPVGILEETYLLVKNALASVDVAADEMYTFSRRKVYFTEAVAA